MSANGWQDSKRLAETWHPPGDGSASMVPPATGAFTSQRTAGCRWCPKYYRGLMPKPLARAARRDVMTGRPRPRTIGSAPLADVPMTDRHRCANPNAVLEADPYARAVRPSGSDVIPGAHEGVHIDWRRLRAVSFGLESRKSNAGNFGATSQLGIQRRSLREPTTRRRPAPPPPVESVEPDISSPRGVERPWVQLRAVGIWPTSCHLPDLNRRGGAHTGGSR